MSEKFNNNYQPENFSQDVPENAPVNLPSVVPVMTETCTGKPPRRHRRGRFWGYVAAVLAGMFLSAVISVSTYALIDLYRDSGITGAPVSADPQEETADSSSGVLTIPEIAEKVGPSVVTIQVTSSTTSWYGYNFEQDGVGSGIIWSEDGYIITNAHVVEGTSKVTVILNTGDEYEGTIIGSDTTTDLAVIKIDASGLPAATFGKSSDLVVGELAVAIGNPLGIEFAGSVTAGVISALDRYLEVDDTQYKLIQTDAAINPGNSGGALINQYGQVIGINTVKISASGYEGMCFAIPIDVAMPILEDLRANGYVTGRPQIGIGTRDITEAMSRRYNYPVGVYIGSIAEFSAAEKAGLQIGDVIVKADGQQVTTTDELNEIKNQHKPGDTLTLEVVRDGRTGTVNVVLDEAR